MILHASSDAKKGKLITTPPHAPKTKKEKILPSRSTRQG